MILDIAYHQTAAFRARSEARADRLTAKADRPTPPAVDIEVLQAGARSIGLDTKLKVKQSASGAETVITVRNGDVTNIDEMILARLPRIADMVRAKTGWPLDLANVTFEFADGATCRKRSLQEAVKRIGIEDPFAKTSWWSRMQTAVMLRMMPPPVAVWLPSEEVMMFNLDALNKVDADMACEITFHELVHTAQDHHAPEFCESINKLAAQAVQVRKERGKRDPEYVEIMDTVGARMALIEGQATALQAEAKAEAFPNGKLNVTVGAILLSLGSLVLSANRRKLMQYLAGSEAYKKIRNEPELIKAVFANPSLCDLMLRTQGKVTVTVPAASADEAATLITPLVKANGRAGQLEIELALAEPKAA
ncbi:MAG: hypothetical protein ACAI38_21385 [Myxococcota bacterium]|nr:hypothetical protein [Myxococcota bacterium]